MEKKSLQFMKVVSFCGACIAFYIGAGFATMQEIIQYVASYGSKLWIVIAVNAAIYIYTDLSFATNGNRLKLKRGGDIYTHYCGKYIGNFFDYFSALFCYACFIVMCGGANATAAQQWGLPNGVGAVILTVFVIATVIFGLDGVIEALGKIGPIIVFFILVVSVISIFNGAGNFWENLKAVDTGKHEIVQVGNGNPFLSGASYAGFMLLWFASFLAEIGSKNRVKEVNIGMLFSAVFIMGTMVIASVALISHVDVTSQADIPALILANTISPALASIFAVIIFCGIYTTSVPLLWTSIGRIEEEGNKKYKLYTVVLGIIGCVIACFLPYRSLVNVLYGLNGYLGFILVAFMLVYDIRTRMSKKVKVAAEEVAPAVV